MIYKYTSCKSVIAKVFTDLNLQEDAQRISDFIEWCGEGLEKIGAYEQYTIKVAGKEGLDPLTIENYQAKLPDDFEKLIQVGYSKTMTGPFFPMRYASGSFDTNRVLTAVKRAQDSVDVLDNASALITMNDVIWTMTLFDLSYSDAMARLQSEPTLKNFMQYLITSANVTDFNNSTDGGTTYTGEIVFTINDNYIKTNVSTGYILLAYLASPTDTEGYPLVPDLASYKEALYWYIVMKMLYPKWLSGEIRADVYYHAEMKWNFYRKQAYAEGMMPDAERLDIIKNIWIKLVPDIDAHDTFFSTINKREHIYTHSYKGRGHNKNI